MFKSNFSAGRRSVTLVTLLAFFGLAVLIPTVYPQVKPPAPPPDPIFPLKIDPKVTAAAQTQARLRLIVYLQNRQGSQIARQEKATIRPQLDTLDAQVRQISLPFRRNDTIPQAIQQQIRSLNVSRESLVRQMRTNTLTRAKAAVSNEQNTFINFVTQNLQGSIHSRLYRLNAVGIEIPSANLTQLVNHPTVFKVRLANIGGQLELDVSVPLMFDTSSGGGHWHDDYGIDGDGIDDVAVIDTGINFGNAGLTSHRGASESFWGQQGQINDTDGHGTMVAGIIASGHHSRTGVAPGIDKLINAKVTNNATTILIAEDDVKEALEWAIQGDTNDLDYAEIDDTAEIVNFSHGWDQVSQENTDYTQVARDFDRFVDDDWVSITKSAGNQGPSARTITVPGDAYNIIVVAAMRNTNLNRADDSILSSSSRGPTRGNSSGTDPYERKKPDLTAPGYYITTKNHNGAWEDGTGTSMAAAHVAGAIALLRDVGPWSPINVKAILINTADDWGSSGWDSTYGWGYINLDNAWNHRWDWHTFFLSPAGQSDYSAYLKGTMQMGDKATVVWNRHEDQNDDRLNDIDLWIYKYDPEESDTIGDALASSVSTVNNVEQVMMPAVATQEVIIGVRCVSFSLAGGISSERVAVAHPSGFSVYTLPGAAPPIQSALSEPNRTAVGQSFPNPLNPETWIPYTLSEDANVTIDIYDAKGELVRALDLGVKPAGRYLTQTTAAHWDGRNSVGERVASGPYFYYFQAGDFKATRKLMVLK